MHAWRSCLLKRPAKLNSGQHPVFSEFFMVILGKKPLGKRFRDGCAKFLLCSKNFPFLVKGPDARDDGNGYSFLPARRDKRGIQVHVKHHLCDGKFCSCIHFLLQVLHVVFLPFWMRSYPNAEIRWNALME